MQSASGDVETLSSCFQHQEGGSSNPHGLVVEGHPVILIVLRRRDVQASSQSWREGTSSHPHGRAEKGMLAVVRRGGVQSFFQAPTTRHGGPVLGHQHTKNALAGKPKAFNQYLCSNGLQMILAVDFGYCYNYQLCLDETYRCNLAQQHVRYACTRKHTLAAWVEISAVLSTLSPL